jgi:arginine utilization protein RocB
MKLGHVLKLIRTNRGMTQPPTELNNKDKKDYIRLQHNITSLLLFEMTGEIRQIA